MFRRDLIAVIHDQLPQGVQDKLTMKVEHDAFYMRASAVFQDGRGGKWETPLEPLDIEGIPVCCKIPEAFVALLCTVA